MPNNDYRNYLMHHGIQGQKWGVRRYQNADGSLTSVGQMRYSRRKANRYAKKDAKEFARAKMYYGEGAGTRRKLIKAKITERSHDPNYKEAFDKHLAKQDMAKHADKARHERRRNTAVKTTKKTARGIMHTVLRTGARTTATAAVIGGAALIAHNYGLDKKVLKWGATKVRDAKFASKKFR